jgi:hypothetical protein
MAGTTFRDIGYGINLLKEGILKDFLINPLTTAQRTTLGGTLGAGNEGLPVYDTDLNTLYVWTGAAWGSTGSSVQTGLTPKGNVAFGDTEPASPTVGDLYVFTSAGTNVWEGSTVVQVGDQVYWDGAAWQFIQGNVLAASETVAGVIEIATQAEVNTATDDVRAVTALKLAAYLANRSTPKVYFNASVTTVANTPLTITHSLGLQNRNAFVLNFMVGNSSVGVDVDSTDVNSLTITSNVALTGAITIIGF